MTTISLFDTIGAPIGSDPGMLADLGTLIANSENTGSNTAGPEIDADMITANSGQNGVLVTGTSGGRLVEESGSLVIGNIGTVATVLNDGTIAVNGTLDVSSAVDPSSNGVFQLTSHSVLEIAAYLGTNLKIQFLGDTPTNELIIDSAASFGLQVGTPSYAGPLLEGFAAGDVIDLKGIAPDGLLLGYSATTGDLQVTGSDGSGLATLSFQDSTLGAGTFHAASDGSGGTLVTHS